MKTYYGIDWNEIWNEVNGANIRCEAFGECATIWQSREEARGFLNNAIKNPERVQFILEKLPLSPGLRVLDIGSGPGTIAVPVAGQVDHVTGVEPSPGMADVMEEYAAEKGVDNLDIIRKRWEEIDLSTDLKGPYDLVFASYSLGMQDLNKSIRMMCDISSKWVYIFWISGTPSWEKGLIKLWPVLHGKEFCCTPQADIIYNVLYSMGIYPNIRVKEIESCNRFPDLISAVSQMSQVYNIENNEQEGILKDYLSEKLVKDKDGFALRETNTSTVIWWETGKTV
ncbi:Methyltransferase type 11 [Methanolacinia petrolearia DSM 11571]|uniref:Methyltransferase type 11 n=1 Tax=Methanolacinia petrolearia (strain DSM 11571 / OCM 486 / SEBR 4847) TaxID=679926 RepID=E1RH61_METP4|nr:class I SAM-dependent methyltransferase [Methanolacinia petrolearia]ADN35285.1 Methyltransferase type 11 [Methanolacinia petrolearia DSM 11571]